jgi:hypothetical protein
MSIYQKIENAISTCRDHVANFDPTDVKDKELESYLVAGLVVLIVSEYEEHLESIFSKRAEICGDMYVANYIKNALSRHFRSPDLSKINSTLQRFDNTYNNAFRGAVENSAEHAAWDSILKARHAVVHKKGSLNLTFDELCQKYFLTKVVIQNLETVLGVDS